MNRYMVRKLENGFWYDECEFFAEKPVAAGEAREAVAAQIQSGSLRLYAPAVLCLVEKLPNGRERIVGGEMIFR